MELTYVDFTQMIEIIKNKRIICWGIGNYFEAFIDSISEYGDKLNIVYLIDNNPRVRGKIQTVFGRNVEIISFQDYLKRRHKQDIIVITTVHYNAIIEQIEKEESCINYISYALIKHGNLKKLITLRRCKEKLIPPIIHYCWFGKGEIPKKDKGYIEGWKDKCPDYRFICWNEDNFDVNRNAFLTWAYNNKKWAFVSDYVRMYALYMYGGIYLDTDVELLKGLDDLRYQYAYMGMEASGSINSGVGMGTTPKNPVIKEIMDYYDNLTDENFFEVNAKRESHILRKYGFRANNHYQIVKNISIYPSEFFSPTLVGKKEINITDNTFSIHHYHYSWLDENDKNKIWK